MCLMVASRLCSRGHTTRIEYMGGCRALPNGERLRCGEAARTVGSESTELLESHGGDCRSLSLSDRLAGKARLMSGSVVGLVSCRKDDADDLSDRRLDWPVSAALVRDWSELPEESAGESRERSEADRLGTGDLAGSLFSDDMLDTRLIGANPGFCDCTNFWRADG